MAVNSFREDEQMKNTDKMKIVKRLFTYLKVHVKAIVGVLICMAIAVAITLINPLIIEVAIDKYIGNSDWSGLIRLGVEALVLNIILIIVIKIRYFTIIWHSCMCIISFHIMYCS